MALDVDTNEIEYKNINYLNNKAFYISDLTDATDIDFTSLYQNVSSMNQITNDYIDDRTNLTPSSALIIGDDELDTSLMNSYLSNNAMLKEKSENEVQYMKNVSNRLKNLKNRSNNNKLVHQILNGGGGLIDGTSTIGELQLADSQIEILKEDQEMRDRQIKISEYYTKKREDQILFFKTASFILVILFVFGILFKFDIISEALFTGIMGCGLAGLVIYIVYKSLDMIFRDKTNYDEYQMFLNPTSYLNLNNNGLSDSDTPIHAQSDDTSSNCV